MGYKVTVFKHTGDFPHKPAGGTPEIATVKELNKTVASIKGSAMPGTMFPYPVIVEYVIPSNAIRNVWVWNRAKWGYVLSKVQ